MTVQSLEPWRKGVAERLAREFDLTEDELAERVLLRAQAVARSYEHGLFPRMAPGQVRHLHMVRDLSEVLRPRGWVRRDDDNISRLVHIQRRTALVVTLGDSATGLPFYIVNRLPRTKYAKGPAMQAAVERNGQLSFDGMSVPVEDREDFDLDGFVTWFLMVYVNKRQIRSEISCPNGVDARGFVTKWHDRLFLPSLPNDGTATDTDFHSDDDPEGGDGGIEVPVEPR
jgi:hypothetical protein